MSRLRADVKRIFAHAFKSAKKPKRGCVENGQDGLTIDT